MPELFLAPPSRVERARRRTRRLRGGRADVREWSALRRSRQSRRRSHARAQRHRRRPQQAQRGHAAFRKPGVHIARAERLTRTHAAWNAGALEYRLPRFRDLIARAASKRSAVIVQRRAELLRLPALRLARELFGLRRLQLRARAWQRRGRLAENTLHGSARDARRGTGPVSSGALVSRKQATGKIGHAVSSADSDASQRSPRPCLRSRAAPAAPIASVHRAWRGSCVDTRCASPA